MSAVHAIRPLARRGEEVIAGAFGLVHGLAFAGILTSLGLDGSASLLALLAFNVGVELAQLLTVALVFPSLYLTSRTRFYPMPRLTGASLALAAAIRWALERLGVLDNPLAATEQAVIDHPWWVVDGSATGPARPGFSGCPEQQPQRIVPRPLLRRSPGCWRRTVIDG